MGSGGEAGWASGAAAGWACGDEAGSAWGRGPLAEATDAGLKQEEVAEGEVCPHRSSFRCRHLSAEYDGEGGGSPSWEGQQT